jgi:hypothetical protein
LFRLAAQGYFNEGVIRLEAVIGDITSELIAAQYDLVELVGSNICLIRLFFLDKDVEFDRFRDKVF